MYNICIHSLIHRKHKRVSLVARNSTVVRFMYSQAILLL